MNYKLPLVLLVLLFRDLASCQVAPNFVPSNCVVAEGNSSNVMTFVLGLTQPATNVVSVNFKTAATNQYTSSSTRATAFAGFDYTPTNGTLIFPIGSTSQTFNVSYQGDLFSEPNRFFWVIYSQPANATFPRLGAEVVTGVIQDDDPSNLPAGFHSTQLAANLFLPTRAEFAPDGRLFICLQEGAIRVFKDGQLLPTPFLQLAVDDEDFGEAGLLGITFDPGFATNQFFYVCYSAWNGAPGTFPAHNRISRFTANGDTANPASELILFQSANLVTTPRHNAGNLQFGPDGKLYLSTGDGNIGASSQSLSSLTGKILRFNADGSIPADNPFYNSAQNEYRAIWALGLRNPFLFAFQPGSNRMFINDVGENTWEEINEGFAGTNYGWPNAEGFSADPAFQNPIFSYAHPAELLNCSGCITGGSFYNPATNAFRAQDVGCYFFSDYCNGWIKRLDPANSNAVSLFATRLTNPVDLKVGPDGNLYYLCGGFSGSLSRIEYSPPSFSLNITPSLSDGLLTISWNSEIGESYQVQFTESLERPIWQNLGAAIQSSDPQTSLTTDFSADCRYFRVRKL